MLRLAKEFNICNFSCPYPNQIQNYFFRNSRRYLQIQTMELDTLSIQLGALSESELSAIQTLDPQCQCSFLYTLQSNTYGSETFKVYLQIRQNYLIQIHPSTNKIFGGVKFDYEIKFQITRTTPNMPQSVGVPCKFTIFFPSQENTKKQVVLIVDKVTQVQLFVKKLQKKYIVQKGFHESFKALKILGKGLTATVYKAFSYRDQKDVAIKSFKRSVYFATPNGRPSFQKQFKILTEMDNKKICDLYSVYESDQTTYIVMQYLSLSLFGWVQKYGFPNLNQGRKIINQLIKGVTYLHSKGIMHRDLKLENIMVKKDEKENPDIVIVDLGLAEYTSTQTFLYSRCGTPGYVAPEILRHNSQSENYNQKCDIFSLGVIFHILTFKKSIFQGQDVREVIKNNTECNINFSAQYFNSISAEGLDLMKKMLEKDPSKRISALEALKHQYLRDLNTKENSINFNINPVTCQSIQQTKG